MYTGPAESLGMYVHVLHNCSNCLHTGVCAQTGESYSVVHTYDCYGGFGWESAPI